MAKRIIRLEHDIDSQDSEPKTKSRSAKPRRSRLKLLMVLALILVGVGVFLPQIISHTSVGDWAIRQFLPGDFGQLTVARRNLSWWGPVEVGDIRLLDPQGKLLAEVGDIKTKETLWQIVSTGQLTRLDVDQAAGRLEWRSDSSNWEDYVFSILETMESGSSSSMADLEIHVTNSQVQLESLTDDQLWTALDVNGVVLVKDNANDIQIQSTCSLLDAKQNLPAGRCETFLAIGNQDALKRSVSQLQIQCEKSNAFNAQTIDGGVAFTAKLEDTAASLGRSILRRYLPTLQLNGLASGKVAGVSNYYGDYVFVQTPKIVIQRLAVGDQEYLAGDFVQQNRVDVIGAFEMANAGLQFQGTRAVGDFGNADLDGTIDYQQLSDMWQRRRLPQNALSSSGKIDLALIASQLPNTLQLREGLEIQQGDLVWQMFNRRESDGSQRLFANAALSRLNGKLGAEVISWSTPIKVTGSLRDYNKPAFVENLNLESSFLNASATPQPDGGALVQFQCDFDQMKAALSQFFQLPPMTMRGKGDGWAKWTLQPTGKPVPDVAAEVALNLQNANLVLPGVFELRDPNIALRAETTVELDGQTPASSWLDNLLQSPDVLVRQGKIELKTGEAALAAIRNTDAAIQPLPGSDVPLGFTATMTKPMQVSRLLTAINRMVGVGAGQPISQQPVAEADIEINGPLENWVEMVRPLLAGSNIAVTGMSQSKAKVTVMDSYVTLGALNLRSTQFGFRGYGTIIQEPVLQLTGGLSYHFDNGLLHLGDLTLNSATAVVRALQTKIRMNQGSTAISGEVGYRINVARLYQTINLMQIADAEDGVRLGANGLSEQQQNWVRSLAGKTNSPQFDTIQLVGLNQPIANTTEFAPAAAGDIQFGGEWVGSAQFTQNEQAETVVKLISNLNQAWIGGIQPNGRLGAYVKEPVIEIKGEGKLTSDANRLEFANVEIRSQRMAAGVAGRVDQLLVNPVLQVNATADASLIDWIRPFAGDSLGDLAIDGLQMHQIELAGPVDINQLSGSWKTNWKSIAWMGLEGGAADIALNMNQGIVKMQPLRFTAGGGKINLAPEVDLRGETVWVRLPRGSVFDQVQLTPQLCRNWLKYAAPLLAEITSVQGTFSLDSDGIEVPISNWQAMMAKARVTINGARVGPGPLGTQIGQVISAVKTVSDGGSLDAAALEGAGLGGLGGLAASGNGQRTAAIEQLASGVLGNLGNGQKPNLGQLVAGNSEGSNAASNLTQTSTKTWMDIPKQTIGINLQDGKVVHDQLTMNIQGFQLVSNGKVGLDQSLDVLTQLNIPQEVLAKNENLANAFGPSLSLPIKGTLSKPSLESGHVRTALNTAVSRTLQKSVGQQLEKKLGVPGLGELVPGQNSGSGNPLNGLMQQGQQQFLQQQQKLEGKLNEKLGLPSGGNTSQDGQGTSPANDLNQMLNKQLDKGLNKLFKNQ